MKRIVILGWLVFGAILAAQLGLLARRYEAGVGAVLHADPYILALAILIALSWLQRRMGKVKN